jgi:hypothetical protein
VFFLVCDGLKSLPEVVGTSGRSRPSGHIHLIRNTAVRAAVARAAMDNVSEVRGSRYPAIIRLWENAWEEFIPFLDYDIEIRTVICSTDGIAGHRRELPWALHSGGGQLAVNRPWRVIALDCRVLTIGECVG